MRRQQHRRSIFWSVKKVEAGTEGSQTTIDRRDRDSCRLGCCGVCRPLAVATVGRAGLDCRQRPHCDRRPGEKCSSEPSANIRVPRCRTLVSFCPLTRKSTPFTNTSHSIRAVPLSTVMKEQKIRSVYSLIHTQPSTRMSPATRTREHKVVQQ